LSRHLQREADRNAGTIADESGQTVRRAPAPRAQDILFVLHEVEPNLPRFLLRRSGHAAECAADVDADLLNDARSNFQPLPKDMATPEFRSRLRGLSSAEIA